MKQELEHRILLDILSLLPQEQVERLKQSFSKSGNPERYLCLMELLVESGTEENRQGVREEWNQYSSKNENQFLVLMDRYIEKYQAMERDEGRKGTLTDLKMAVSNHSKWHRMLRDCGRGNQYHDDMRRACFVFRLSYEEALELLWSAGQPLDHSERRDFTLAECLLRGIYDPEKIDLELDKMKERRLFCE